MSLDGIFSNNNSFGGVTEHFITCRIPDRHDGSDSSSARSQKTYSNLTSENIRRAVRNGAVTTDRYILLYLYDPKTESVSLRFLNEYGAILNNRLKSDLPMFTIYQEETFRKWSDNLTSSARETLKEQFECSDYSTPQYEQMLQLAIDYKLDQALPALVIIDEKQKVGYTEAYTSVSLRSCSTASMIYDRVCAVLAAMDAHPDDFEYIKDSCNGRMEYGAKTLSENLEQSGKNVLYTFLSKLIKVKDGSIDRCAQHIGMSKNTLGDYMDGKRRIKTENLFTLAFYLQLKPEELNWIFYEYSDASPLEIQNCRTGRDKRYSAILRLLGQGVNLYRVNDRLQELGFAPIESLSGMGE